MGSTDVGRPCAAGRPQPDPAIPRGLSGGGGGGVSAKAINKALTLLSVCMNEAVDYGLIAADPCLRVRQLPVVELRRRVSGVLAGHRAASS